MRLKLILLLLFLFLPTRQVWAQIPTYQQAIAPLIRRSCMPCHRGDDIGPMPLNTYREVRAYGQMIRYVTAERLMPPFRAVSPVSHFVNERRLTDKEVKMIADWVENGMPEGYASVSQPQLAELTLMNDPDLTLSMAQSFEQYGVYYDQYRVFVLPTGLTEDRLINDISFEPGNRSIVKGVMISVDTGQYYEPLDAWDPQYGYFSFGGLGFLPSESRWYTWAAGEGTYKAPQGSARYLPKGAKLLVHIHYGPTGVPQRDSSVVKLKWATGKPSRLIRTAPLLHPAVMTNDSFLIPAGEKHRVHASFVVPHDIELLSLMPHSHFLGRKWEVFVTYPEEKKAETLLEIKDWDFHFKQAYTFLKPKLLPRGAIVHALAEYDNTAENLANPSDPPRTMEWGKRMYEEMFLVYFSYRQVEEATSGFQLLPGTVNLRGEREVIPFNIEAHGRFSLEIRDFSGKVVRKLFDDRHLKSGSYHETFGLSGLPYGNYVIVLRDEKMRESRRIVTYLATSLFE